MSLPATTTTLTDMAAQRLAKLPSYSGTVASGTQRLPNGCASEDDDALTALEQALVMAVNALSERTLDCLVATLLPRVAITLHGLKATEHDAPQASDESMRLLTVKDTVSAVNLSESTIRRAIRAGELPASKIGGRIKIRHRDVERWIAGGRIAPTGSRECRPRTTGSTSVQGLRRFLDTASDVV